VAYLGNVFTKNRRKYIHDIDHQLEPFHHVLIAFPKLMEGVCLLSKHGGDRFDRIAGYDLGGERM
jgi:hypothetical protein